MVLDGSKPSSEVDALNEYWNYVKSMIIDGRNPSSEIDTLKSNQFVNP